MNESYVRAQPHLPPLGCRSRKMRKGSTAGQQLGDLDSSSCLLPVHIEEGLLILPALQDQDQRRGIGCGHPLSAR